MLRLHRDSTTRVMDSNHLQEVRRDIQDQDLKAMGRRRDSGNNLPRGMAGKDTVLLREDIRMVRDKARDNHLLGISIPARDGIRSIRSQTQFKGKPKSK